MIELAARTAALESSVRTGEGRLDAALVADALAVVERARERMALSAEHTVVALAGATGSGKSSVFNALAGADLATVGVTRPTTSHALAAVRGAAGSAGAGALLEWLEVRRRHELPADGASGASARGPGGGRAGTGGTWGTRGTGGAGAPADGLVLLDLPDHDSVVTDHRERAERVVARADLLVWVVDPQKYADAALHERYLRPLAGHASVVVVVLNQVDRLSTAEAAACLGDLRRLVADDGLADARVLAVSARTGAGMDGLRELLDQAVVRRRAANDRLVADERVVALRVAAQCGEPPPARDVPRARAALVGALEAAAGVPTVVAAVRASAVRDARRATGWPVTRWVGRLRPDPLRRLGLRRDGPAARPDLESSTARSSLPPVPATVAARARGAVRDYVDSATRGVPDAWVLAMRARVDHGTRDLTDALDQAVVATELRAARRPRWWPVVGAVQWAVLAVLAVGLAWLGVLAVLTYLQVSPPTPVLSLGGLDVPWPTLLALGGAVVGILVALVARVAAALGGRRQAARARRRLRTSVGTVATTLVRVPVAEELAALARCRATALVAAS